MLLYSASLLRMGAKHIPRRTANTLTLSSSKKDILKGLNTQQLPALTKRNIPVNDPALLQRIRPFIYSYRPYSTDVAVKTGIYEGKKEYKILTIDGGGIRGIIPAMVLTEIEKRTKKPIAELFDYIGGTSTGGILALGLNVPHTSKPNKPLYKAEELLPFYKKHGAEIFEWSLIIGDAASLT